MSVPVTLAFILGAAASGSAERANLRRLREECNRLPLAHDPRQVAEPGARRAELARVYVDLQTTSAPDLDRVFARLEIPSGERPKALRALRSAGQPGSRPSRQPAAEGDTALWLHADEAADLDKHPLRPWAANGDALRAALQPLMALEAIQIHPQLVLLGDPGGGKSTLVNHLAHACAGGLLETDPLWRNTMEARFPAPFFPLRVIVRRWSGSLDDASVTGLPLVQSALQAASGLDAERLAHRLEQPQTLILIDGLDEAPPADGDRRDAPDRRRLLLESVAAFAAAYPGCRLLVTSRVRPYRDTTYQLPGLPTVTLAPLDSARVERFVHRWYDELGRVGQLSAAQATTARERLLAALQVRRDLREMAETPLLLTMLARINARTGLPESRARLYEECVAQLLWEWEKAKPPDAGGGHPDLHVLLQLDEYTSLQPVDLERVLWQVTYDHHGASGSATADLPAAELEGRLAAIHPQRHLGKAWPSRVVALIQERAGPLHLPPPHLPGVPGRPLAAGDPQPGPDRRRPGRRGQLAGGAAAGLRQPHRPGTLRRRAGPGGRAGATPLAERRGAAAAAHGRPGLARVRPPAGRGPHGRGAGRAAASPAHGPDAGRRRTAGPAPAGRPDPGRPPRAAAGPGRVRAHLSSGEAGLRLQDRQVSGDQCPVSPVCGSGWV